MLDRVKSFNQFVVDTWAELKKTTWPAKQEVYGTTLVVIITVLICAGYLYVVDVILKIGMQGIYRVFGQ